MSKPTRVYPLNPAAQPAQPETAAAAYNAETAAGMTDMNAGRLVPVVVGTVGQEIPALADLQARIIVPAAVTRPR